MLAGGYGISYAYGIVLQAVELATAFMLGVPALISTGLSWNDIRPRAPRAANGG